MIHKLEVKLKQHTPLIHFQHDQEGATLRASEVKPKLDKYILKQLDTELRVQGESQGWIKRNNDKVWLDYKMQIVAGGRRYEHTLSIINDKNKCAVVFEEVTMTIRCPEHLSILSETLKKHIRDFFVVYNFGFRQSKGYGSFTVKTITLNGEIQQPVVEQDYQKILSNVYESVQSFPINKENISLGINLSKYIALNNEAYRYNKKKINEICTIQIPVDRTSFNANFVFCDHKASVQKKIDEKVQEVRGLKNDNGYHFEGNLDDLIASCKCKEKIDEIHHDFLFRYFEAIDKSISDKYQLYKSGRNYPYNKSGIRNFWGGLQNNTEIVYWDKRFIKQKIQQLNLSPRLKDLHQKDGESEISRSDPKNQSYFFIRALLGLEGNFEFQTEDPRKKYVVLVEKNKDIERFQSIIIFKVIDNKVYTCIKPKQELKQILNKSFNLTVKIKGGGSLSTGKEYESLGEIQTPDLTDDQIDQLYEDILNYFCPNK